MIKGESMKELYVKIVSILASGVRHLLEAAFYNL